MLKGYDLTMIGSGKLRDVYLVEYEGRQLAVKTLRHVNELTRQKVHLSMHRREVLTLDAVSRAALFATGLHRSNVAFVSNLLLVQSELFQLSNMQHQFPV